MTVTEMTKLLGTHGHIYVRDSLYAEVIITDAKDGGWGRTLYLIAPVRGEGAAWVDSNSVIAKAKGGK